MAVIDKISVKNTSYDIGADSDNVVYDSNNSVKDKIDEYEVIIPSSASSSNKLATANDIPSLTNYIEKSQTTGLVKNDGTIDTNTYAQTSDLPGVATSSTAGLVKPDDVTIVVDANGTLSTTNSGTVTQIKVGTTDYDPVSGVVSLPAYPTSLPASNTTDIYSSTGTAPVSGKAIAAALGTLDVTGATDISSNKTISSQSETDGKVNITTQDISITKSQVSDFPTLGTAAAKDVPASGNASTTQVVLGSDTRLSDSRPASDVSSQAKAANKPSYAYSEITDKPSLGTASAKDVPATGNASSTQVVMGNDTRLSDSRPASDVSSQAKASSKPSYTASEVGAIASTAKGTANGVAELGSDGKVPSSQLPSYVDDVLEYDSKSSFPTTGEAGKIYVDKTTNLTWRWSGTTYVEISPSLALGETSSTAYRGDRGKIAYDHSQSTHARTDATAVAASSTNGNIKINGAETTVYTHPGSGTNPHGTTKSDVGLGNVGNFKAVSTVASQGLTDTEKSNARANIGAGTSSFSGNYNDLTNKPTIPTVNNGTLTIQKNGTNVATFTANQSGNATANITVPTTAADIGAATSGHTHTTSIATDSGTNQLTMAANTKYKITAGGTNYIFTTPPDTNTWRGIQDNLTSTSTSDSLSANQGRLLANGSARDSTKLPLAGGNMTGTVTFNKVTNAISYTGTKATYSMIRFKDNTDDEYGNGIVIGGGGLTVIGGGEAADTVAATHATGGDEVLELASDQNVQIQTNVQDGTTNAKKFIFGTNGVLTTPAGVSGLTNSQITTALGYTPYNSTNPNGYTSNTGTITGITMNGASKGTSGVVNLGTVITDVSGKADKSATVSTVTWDTTNKKITKTINGTTTDVVTGATILSGLTKSQVTTALGYTPPTSDTNTHRPIQVNGTEILGNNTTALNLKAGSNVSVTNSSGTVTIAATDTTYSNGTGLNLSSNTFSVKYGTAAGTACQGNDSRLSQVYVSGPNAFGTVTASTTDLEDGVSSLASGAIYLVYET